MDKVRKILNLEFWLPILVSLVIIVLYETEILLPGMWATDKLLQYYLAITMELVTISFIPLSLKLFKFKKVKASIEAEAEGGLRKWGQIRITMLTLPMMLNTWLYYQFIGISFGYMGIIGLLCLFFVYPSKTRCNSLS